MPAKNAGTRYPRWHDRNPKRRAALLRLICKLEPCFHHSSILERAPLQQRIKKSMNRVLMLASGSILVGVVVLALKSLAYFLTGSVALLSDAIESTVNVVTAIAAFIAIRRQAIRMQSIRMDITRRSIFPLCSKVCSLSSPQLPFFWKPISASSHPDSWMLLGWDLQ
jgi:hypothetical protein